METNFNIDLKILLSFINLCDKTGIIPDERHIDEFLGSTFSKSLRPLFIKFCFYHWETNNIVSDFKALYYGRE